MIHLAFFNHKNRQLNVGTFENFVSVKLEIDFIIFSAQFIQKY